MSIDLSQYNLNSPSVRRILKEIKELSRSKSSLFVAAPLENNIFEWHFTIRGPKNTEFEGGIYHGKILLPSDYPLKPPDIIFLTPNGRFEVEKKICLTISSHHAETWRPSWSVRTAVLAIIGFFPTKGDGAIASLDWTKEERIKAAKNSLKWKCEKCMVYNITALPSRDGDEEEEEALDLSELSEIKIKNKEEQEKDDKKNQTTNSDSKTEESPTTITTTTATAAGGGGSAGGDGVSIEDHNSTNTQRSAPSSHLNEESLPVATSTMRISSSSNSKAEKLDYVIWAIIFLLFGLLVNKFLL